MQYISLLEESSVLLNRPTLLLHRSIGIMYRICKNKFTQRTHFTHRITFNGDKDNQNYRCLSRNVLLYQMTRTIN